MHPTHTSTPASDRTAAFTLIELLVVVALLMAILLPALSRARDQAKTTKCLANMRNMQIAQIVYSEENDGYLIQAGLPHGGGSIDPGAWIYTLQLYYSSRLLARCPSDQSPLWPALSGTTSDLDPAATYRRTSYGINNFLDVHHPYPSPSGSTPPPYTRMQQIRTPGRVLQFLEITETGSFAVSDHTHIENWGPPGNTANLASANVQIDRHSTLKRAQNSRTNWGFLDGRAETLPFKEVFTNQTNNLFDPGNSN